MGYVSLLTPKSVSFSTQPTFLCLRTHIIDAGIRSYPLDDSASLSREGFKSCKARARPMHCCVMHSLQCFECRPFRRIHSSRSSRTSFSVLQEKVPRLLVADLIFFFCIVVPFRPGLITLKNLPSTPLEPPNPSLY